MSTQVILIIVAVLAVLIAVLAARGGPRVTQITRTIRRKKEDRE
jgi:hypothetical protein